ncbi:hypothetical protein KUL97_01165, partial [Synechococcus sp. HK05]|uniref:hypothetical protein n=1 Tax=Synechococcus sp. HK05 TaxID=2725975 RepID=UPI001C38A0B4
RLTVWMLPWRKYAGLGYSFREPEFSASACRQRLIATRRQVIQDVTRRQGFASRWPLRGHRPWRSRDL